MPSPCVHLFLGGHILHAPSLNRTGAPNFALTYEGDAAYEERYLNDFLASDDAVMIVARAGGTSVGMATASPLSAQAAELVAPLGQAGFEIDQGFYFGESVTLPQFRGKGLGHRFFDEREKAAREAKASFAAFCAVIRPYNHPLRPADARDLHPFWYNRGYEPVSGCTIVMAWPDRGSALDTSHAMQFWWKPL